MTWKAREVGLSTRFIELAGRVNHAMPDYVVKQTVEALNQHSKPVRQSRILILGLAYKPNVDDVRESPSFELIQKLPHSARTLNTTIRMFPPLIKCVTTISR